MTICKYVHTGISVVATTLHMLKPNKQCQPLYMNIQFFSWSTACRNWSSLSAIVILLVHDPYQTFVHTVKPELVDTIT